MDLGLFQQGLHFGFLSVPKVVMLFFHSFSILPSLGGQDLRGHDSTSLISNTLL